MIFWGVEVKSGQHVLVQPGNEMLLHVSQACLGGIKKDKGSEYVRLYAKKNGQKFLLGILSAEKFPHLNFDVVFEDDFELSHDGKNESIHFAGYKSQNPNMDEEEIETDDSDGERVPMKALDNGTSQTKEDKPAAEKIIAPSKPEAAAGKSKGKIVEPNKDDKQSEDSDDSKDSDHSDSSDSDSDEDVEGGSDDDSSDEDGEDDESDEGTTEKPETSKKRTAEASTKTAGPDKKAKFGTPVKNDDKKPIPHVATPYPSKQVGKLPANNDKSKQQTPKSSGSFACNSCSRSFGSEQALQSHSKAKHAAK